VAWFLRYVLGGFEDSCEEVRMEGPTEAGCEVGEESAKAERG
jgi:hypothetical protein